MRRGHTKSRKGCSNCKRRRVKCDETQPRCLRCIKSKISCSFPSAPPSFMQVVNHPSHTKSVNTAPTTSPNLPTLDTQSLEIFHHYITTACLSLATPDAISLWRTTIPQMAFSHTFLLKGILAVSALHLATLQADRASEMYEYASHSAQLGFPLFRQFVAEDKYENVHVVFAFSSFVVPYVFIMFGSRGDKSCQIPSLDSANPHWLLVVRGHVTLLARNWQNLVTGPFSLLLDQSPGPFSSRSNPNDDHLARFHEILVPPENASAEEEEEMRVCRVALDELRRVFGLRHTASKTLSQVSAIYLWAGIVSDEYLKLVHKRKPEALVVLANYCVLLQKESSLWYFKGVGEGMLEAINDELDEKWKPWILWATQDPLDEIEITNCTTV